ncbi:alpha-L-fucosidase [candidate division KSB1 bacterium 4484_87]|nr:MAG: alpha-L-fucosidase [candidate division KSB1 bacterium 4484_87]
MYKTTFSIILTTCFSFLAIAGAPHPQENQHGKYYPVSDPLVVQKLEKWQDAKFGLLMHWGTYSQWGIVESWSLCPEDYGWCERKKGANPKNYFEYKKEYENLIKTFNPTKFAPKKWAEAAQAAGMKYVVFTTKHHDGFCLWDTKETDYKITSKDCPFHSNPHADVTKEIFNAFRENGFMIGAYFSKADWHTPYYWDPYFPPLDRNVNYDPEQYPERWNQFVQFTHNQIMELMSNYGKIDILWLDAGWVAKQSTEEINHFYSKELKKTESGFLKQKIVNQDIRMDELVQKARAKQPGLIVVDRAVSGPNQNYLTPENQVPKEPIPYPWESCIISGGGWSYAPNAKYKFPRQVIHLLVDIVAKGGNLLLNIAPGPDGTWQEGAYKMLAGVGSWMKVNREAIYATRAIKPYKDGNICFTKKKNENIVYAIYLSEKGESTPPAKIRINDIHPANDSSVSLLGTNTNLVWKKSGKGFVVQIPRSIQNNPPCDHAWVFKFKI